MNRTPLGYSVVGAHAKSVRVGDLVQQGDHWHRIRDLRQVDRDRRAAVLDGLPGVWLLPVTFAVMRPVRP
ncbi:polysaccharide deacetylase [Streptomyces laurentii]|uniref:Polysaccharide deacetylase n=1 Tax=Streptomyces laurentii TaxID=39478 RepID=A0A161JH70_STRLU|nr:polysaccharide deacetylase [Streptomyces laurentii]